MNNPSKVHVRWVCPACHYKHAWQWDYCDGRDIDMSSNKCGTVTNMGMRKQPDGSWEARADWPPRNTKLDIRGMRKLADALGRYPAFMSFTWTVLTTRQVRESGIRDPACSIVQGTWGPFCIEIDSDGETAVSFHVDGNGYDKMLPTNLDMSLPPVAICFTLSRQIHALRS